MLISIYGAMLLGVVMLTVLKSPNRSKAVRESEESAHSTAAEKRGLAIEARREMRYPAERLATVSVLGEPNRQASCRIINTSRSGLRIGSSRQFPKGAQVCVQWGEEFFVGAVLYTFVGKTEHVAGLELLSGNHRWHPLARFCFWRRFAGRRA
jgi:hypothetical protein